MNQITLDTYSDRNTKATVVKIGQLELYFSYQTVVAFSAPNAGLVVSENIWSNTTGKHLNEIDNGRKSDRVKHDDFKIKLRSQLAEFNLIID